MWKYTPFTEEGLAAQGAKQAPRKRAQKPVPVQDTPAQPEPKE